MGKIDVIHLSGDNLEVEGRRLGRPWHASPSRSASMNLYDLQRGFEVASVTAWGFLCPTHLCCLSSPLRKPARRRLRCAQLDI